MGNFPLRNPAMPWDPLQQRYMMTPEEVVIQFIGLIVVIFVIRIIMIFTQTMTAREFVNRFNQLIIVTITIVVILLPVYVVHAGFIWSVAFVRQIGERRALEQEQMRLTRIRSICEKEMEKQTRSFNAPWGRFSCLEGEENPRLLDEFWTNLCNKPGWMCVFD